MANGKSYTSVVAIGRSGDWYRAVEVNHVGSRFEITRYFSCETVGKNLAAFAAELTATGWLNNPASGLVVLYDGQSVAYRHIEVPDRPDRELESIVRMQAEAMLPLEPQELEIGWRQSHSSHGKVGVTLAAIKRDNIKSFAEEAAAVKPARIVLEIDGFVRAWCEACSFEGASPILIRVRDNATDVCLVENSLLSLASRIDTGLKDLFKDQTLSVPDAEQLKNDIEAAAALFAAGKDRRFYIVSDGSANIAAVSSYLSAAGLPVQVSSPRGWAARDGAAISAAELYQYMAHAGAAMLVLEGTRELNIFSRLYRPQEAAEQTPAGPGLRKAAAIAAAALIALLFIRYGLDKLELHRLQAMLNEKHNEASALEMLEKCKAVNETAAERPDMLEVFTLVKESAPEDVTFHSFTFRKGKPVSVTGQARTNDSLYKFEAALRTQKGISNVKEQSAVKDENERKVVFTVTFDYRTFTKGQAEPLAAFGR